jgi:hypothetical protein
MKTTAKASSITPRILREKAAVRGWTNGKDYGPHDLDNSHWLLPGSERVQDLARNLGIHFMVVPRIHNKQDSIEAARNFLSMAWVRRGALRTGHHVPR